MQYITFRLQTDCNQTFHSPSFSIKYVLYFLYLMAIAQYTLGMFYQDGKLIERDLESARYWLNQAALNYAPGDDFLDDLARRIKLLLTGEQDS